MASSASSSQSAFLFIPDITGFTRFISDRDFEHGQHIMAELLEVLIEANDLNLKVNEVEGDAVFFYRTGAVPDIKELIAQSEKMYMAFHSHLKKYGVSRICNCPTCRSASRLTLKFIAHYGGVSFHKVKEHQKLFGTDVILVHRLLKNNVPEKEYLLVTNNVVANHSVLPNGDHLQWQNGSESYDLGDVSYSYTSLKKWYELVPEPEISDVVVYRSENPLPHFIEIDAPAEIIYDSLTDLNQRKNYMAGVNAVWIKEQETNRLNRICTTFKCAMEHEQCTFETSGVEFGDERVSFTETFKGQPMTLEYVIEQKNGKSAVSILIHQAMKFPMNWAFHLFMKGKLISQTNKTLQRLKKYCEEKHQQKIKLKSNGG